MLRIAIGVGATLLLVVTVLVFRAIDLNSHSVSDTLRPFILLATPVWTAAILAARALLRRANR